MISSFLWSASCTIVRYNGTDFWRCRHPLSNVSADKYPNTSCGISPPKKVLCSSVYTSFSVCDCICVSPERISSGSLVSGLPRWQRASAVTCLFAAASYRPLFNCLTDLQMFRRNAYSLIVGTCEVMLVSDFLQIGVRFEARNIQKKSRLRNDRIVWVCKSIVGYQFKI